MKVVIMFILLMVTLGTASAQGDNNKFRLDYNYISVYDGKTKKWGEWEEGINTFIINFNERGDIACLMANGQTVIYKKISTVEEGWTTSGKRYQITRMIDENGDVFSFQLFDDPAIGVKLIYEGIMIQFTNF